jgi:hypothetical protein
MAFIGKGLKDVSTVNITVDSMVGDGSTNTLVLSQVAIESVIDVSVYYQGVAQVPVTDYTLTGSTLTFTTIPPVGTKVIAVTKADSFKNRVNDKSVVNASFADNAITSSKIIGLDASKLTGVLPAMDGSALTNVNIPSAPLESNVTDPTITSNKTLGTVWVNTATGNMFVLTDATTDQNVWINVGVGTDSVAYVPVLYNTRGSSFGYSSGGRSPSADIGNIQKYAFSSSTTTATVGSLSVTRYTGEAGTSSFTHGYCVAGYNNTINAQDGTIDKFEFATDSSATGVGDCATTGNVRAGASSATHGYIGGNGNASTSNGDKIEKYSFAADANSANVATLSAFRSGLAGVSSSTTGYFAGGRVGATYQDDIESITFSSDTANGNVGELSGTRRCSVGHQTSTYGYIAGGFLSGSFAVTNIVDCFAFASSVTTTDVGDMYTGRSQAAPASSITHGYTSGGGIAPEGTNLSTIERYQFASGNAITSTGIGNLAVACYAASGHQV